MTAASFVPHSRDLRRLAEAAKGCEGCPLFRDAEQTVFGEGGAHPTLVLVGEQPGDVEDRRGHPFVGPAGAVLWKCVAEAGIDRDTVYATNAVKHFKHELRGKRRLHKKPNQAEVEACHPWLDAELVALPGTVVVALGATAARAVLDTTASIGASRGRRFEVAGHPVVVTYHPSAILRGQERAGELRAALVEDLRRAARIAG